MRLPANAYQRVDQVSVLRQAGFLQQFAGKPTNATYGCFEVVCHELSRPAVGQLQPGQLRVVLLEALGLFGQAISLDRERETMMVVTW